LDATCCTRTQFPRYCNYGQSCMEEHMKCLYADILLVLKLKLNYDRQSVGQSVLVSGTRDQFFFLLKIFFSQLRVCYFIAPSLTRGRVFNLLLLVALASAVPLGSESRGTRDLILLSQSLRLLQPREPGPRIYIPQEQGGPVIPPGTGFPFCRLLRLAGTTVEYSI
jgi:hypothetical protein